METTTKPVIQAKDSTASYPYEGTIRDFLDPLETNRKPTTRQLKSLIRKEELVLRTQEPESFKVGRLLDLD